MADHAPDVKIEVEVPDAGIASAGPGPEEVPPAQGRGWSDEDYSGAGRTARAYVDGARRKATAFADGVAPGHGNEIFWGFMGFVCAILVFILGFWQTLFVAFLVVVGVAFGQYLDGDPKIIRALMRLIRPSDSYPRT